MSDSIKTNVLIVGSGPSGMTMALALAKFGIPCIIIDRREDLYMEPRAHALNPRTLEIFSSLGINTDDFKAVATPTNESCWVRWVDTLSGGEFGKLPYEKMQPDENLPTPFPLFNIAQPAAEKVIQSYISQDDKIQVLRPWQWQSCTQVSDGVESIVIDDKGNERRIFSRYLIGADGAGSPVRTSQNIAMKGMGIVHDFLMIHFKADLSDIVKNNPAILYWIMKQECSGTLIAYNIRDNWVFMYPYDKVDNDISDFKEDFCKSLLKKAIGQSNIDIEILSIGGWVLGSQVAQSFSKRNVFLVGDAAHRYPPSGGLGLNTGVGDAHNLAWKIAGVLQGWAWPTLLDSYNIERRPVAQNNADFSTENAGKLFNVMLATGTLMPNGMQPSFDTIKADPEKWAAVQDSIEEQRDHFDGLALQIGQHYGRSTPPDLRASDFQYKDVGARFAHTWININDEKASSLELLCSTSFTIIARKGFHIPVINCEIPYQIKTESNDFFAKPDSLQKIGLDEANAIIVRPDGHIAKHVITSTLSDEQLQNLLRSACTKYLAFPSIEKENINHKHKFQDMEKQTGISEGS